MNGFHSTLSARSVSYNSALANYSAKTHPLDTEPATYDIVVVAEAGALCDSVFNSLADRGHRVFRTMALDWRRRAVPTIDPTRPSNTRRGQRRLGPDLWEQHFMLLAARGVATRLAWWPVARAIRRWRLRLRPRRPLVLATASPRFSILREMIGADILLDLSSDEAQILLGNRSAR